MRKTVMAGLLAALLLLSLGVSRSWADGAVSLHALSILASDNPAPMDARLEKVEFALRRILGFEHYRFLAEGSALLSLPGETTIGLNNGFFLEVKGWKAGDGKVRAEVRWFSGSQQLLSTAVVLKRGGKPAVLGGVPHEDGKSIIVLSAE